MNPKGAAKRTSNPSNIRTTKRAPRQPSSSLSPPPNDVSESTSTLSVTAPVVNTSGVSLTALAQSYTEHRDEVMEILLKLTKALKDEREWRDATLTRLSKLETEVKTIKETTTKDTRDLEKFGKSVQKLDENMEDVLNWSDFDDEGMMEDISALTTRLDLVELELSVLRKGKEHATPEEAQAAIEDQFTLHQMLAKKHREEDGDVPDLEIDEENPTQS